MFEKLKIYFGEYNFILYNYHFEYNFLKLIFKNEDGRIYDIHILDNHFDIPSHLKKDINNNDCYYLEYKNYLIISYSNKLDLLLKLCEKLSDLIFINFRYKLFPREYKYLHDFIKLDKKINNKILIYSNSEFIKPILYLFRYKNFKNFIFYLEKGIEINLKNIKGIIILMHPICKDLLVSDKELLLKIKKYYVGYNHSMLDKKGLCKLINDYSMEVISNNTKEDLDEMNNNLFNIDYTKFNYSYLGKFDLFGHSKNFKMNYVNKKYISDIVISIGPFRNIDFFIENINFFKKYKCIFININHHAFKHQTKLSFIKSLNIDNFIFLDFLDEKEYNLYFHNTKLIIVPFKESNQYWMTFTQGDIMMYGKSLLIGENRKTKFFQKYNNDGYCNYELLSNDYVDYIKKIIKNKEYRKIVEKESYLSYIRDFAIERIILQVSTNIGK